MKKTTLISVLFFISTFSFSQIEGIVLDSATKKPIPYVNIWLEDENNGTTSDKNGKFALNEAKFSRTIVLSAIGYEKKKVVYKEQFNTIKLVQQDIELSEVVIKKSKNRTLKIGKFKKNRINYSYGSSNLPAILARYFPYNSIYKATPFLKTVRFNTKNYSRGKAVGIFKIVLYSVSKTGKPETTLLKKNIFAFAKRGSRYTEANLEKYNIPFPEKGFFVAVEALIIDDNKYEIEYKPSKTSLIKKKRNNYAPFFGMLPFDSDDFCYIYNQGKWRPIYKSKSRLTKKYHNKYPTLAVELTLTN